MPDIKISAGADPVTLVATDKVPLARSASTTAYAATMAELASYANTAYTPNYFIGTPSMDGTGAAGSVAFVARGDHVHPSDTTRVAKAGDTMGGFLTLNANPTANLHAATKQYVDGSAPVGGPYLPLAGGVLTGALTPAQVAGVVGTTTNNNAAAGAIGEFISANVVSGSAVAMTTNVGVVVASVALTAGDWGVQGTVNFSPAGTTVTTAFLAGVSNSAALTGTWPNGTYSVVGPTANNAGVSSNVPVPTYRYLLAAPTTIYLLAQASFGVSTMAAWGWISARRAR